MPSHVNTAELRSGSEGGTHVTITPVKSSESRRLTKVTDDGQF